METSEAPQRTLASAEVIPIERAHKTRKLKAREAKRKSAKPPQALVALWFGAAIFSGLIAVGVGVSAALEHGLPGIGILFAVGLGIGSLLATRWLASSRGAARQQSETRHPSGIPRA